MKTLRILSFAMIIALAFANCGTEKKTNDDGPGFLKNKPCYEQSLSTSTEFREIGYGIHSDLDKASILAIDNAKEKMRKRLKTYCTNLIKDHYIKSSDTTENMNRFEKEINDGVEGIINNLDNPCYDYIKVENENKWYYVYVVSANKQDLDAMVSKKLNEK